MKLFFFGILLILTFVSSSVAAFSNKKYDTNKNGSVIVYDEKGKLVAKKKIRNGLIVGFVNEFYNDGQIKSSTQYNYGVPDGLATKYYPNGEVFVEQVFDNGKLVGLETIYYENGKKKIETSYRDGQRHGYARSYYRNGNLWEEIKFSNGLQVGLTRILYENGAPKTEKFFNDLGQCMRMTNYDEFNQVTYNGKCERLVEYSKEELTK